MDILRSINKWVIGYSPIKHTILWNWYRLINHRGWRLDDRHLYYDFWYVLNHGWEHMTYVHKFEEFWGKGSYPPERIVLSSKNFDALVERLNAPPDPKVQARIKELLERKAPWEI
jgi:hypothetical protein